MKHEECKEKIILSLLGELVEEEQTALDAHLAGCAGCRADYEGVKSYVSLIREAGVTGPSDELLGEARRELREALAGEAGLARAVTSRDNRLTQDRAWSQSGHSRFPVGLPRAWIGWFTPARVALAGTAAVVIGFFAGYLVFGRMDLEPSQRVPTDTAAGSNGAAIDRELGAPSYDNVRLAGIDPRSSEVEIEYDMVRPVRLKADIEDDRVQRILARSVMTDANAGARLQAINTIGAYVDAPRSAEIKKALIHAVKTDSNAGVRKQALYVVYQLPFDDDIKNACLHVLASDENEGMRIAAINILAVAVLDGDIKGGDVFDAVGARLQQDDNEYIRMQSGAFQQEVNGHGE
jgi:hypothetical protein